MLFLHACPVCDVMPTLEQPLKNVPSPPQAKPLVTSVMDGYNVCIFAYGQTGAGKTHTMEGPPENRGVNHRALAELFRIAEDRADGYEYKIIVSMMEVYNEVMQRD